MAVDIPYRRDIAFEYGRLETIAPGLRRIVAQNPGPFTFQAAPAPMSSARARSR